MVRKILLLCLVVMCGLAIGCAVSSTPPASEYPADISGHVTIAEKVIAKYQSGSHAGETMDMIPLEGKIYWIVDISVKNKAYENAVTVSSSQWKIVANDTVYDAQSPFMSIQSAYPMSVPMGETGETTIRFPVPDTLEVSSAKLCYQGQEPYSYGELSGGDKVAAYDWDLKKVVQEAEVYGELYTVPDEHGGTTTMQLRTVARWSGTEDEVINFSIDKSPWVINGSYEVVSSLGHKFDYLIFTEEEYSVPDEAFRKYIGHEFLMPTRFQAGRNYLVKQSGHFFICVYASGVRWELKVGVE